MRQRGDSDRLRRDFDLSDVCQSVFRSFFQGLRENRYRLEQPADIERLLHTMIRFNVATKARRSSVRLRELIDDFQHGGWVSTGRGPDEKVADQDLIEAIQAQFSDEELEILTLWLDDVPWAEIGQKLGCTPDSVRVRMSRAVTRVREKLPGSGNDREDV
jgi:RNA polymerase sigma factor (sigma-70 family)